MKKTQKIGLLLLLLCAVAVFAVACKADPKPVGPTSYTISFYSDDQLTDTLQTVGGESLTLPVPAEREHFRFDGWFFDKGTWQDQLTADTYSDKNLSGNQTVYAKWTQTEFNVTFEENGGSSVADGWFASVESSPASSKDHFRFDGWFTSPDFSGNAVAFPYTPAKDVTLYAKWTQTEFNVTFEENGGTTVADGW
ncbi:MAG TPA: InlB B-repeat-containing protein, partial [Candidatus Borkfalkia faecipullorum]|nr:InlB B-repeat-containing protein [Candidatus Borkfalkia faecipullorum]